MRRSLAGIAVLVFLSLAVPAAGQSPLGAEFRVNTTSGAAEPSAAGNGSGAFVVTWWRTNYGGIYGQRYAPGGAPLGGEFTVNSSSTSFTYRPAVAMRPGGDFVVVWMSSIPGYIQVVARRFSSSGAPVGTEFRVDTSNDQARSPRVAYDADGGFSVVWQQNPLPYIAYRRYDASGNALGGVGDLSDLSRVPDIAALPGGDFVVTWFEFLSPGQIWAERLDSTGNSLGGGFRVDGYGIATGYSAPRVSADSAGNFTVAWFEPSGYFLQPRIAARRYAASGSPVGGEFQVGLDGSGVLSLFLGAATAGNGDVFVAWPKSLGVDTEARGRLLSAGEMRVNTYTTGSNAPSAVAAVSPGEFVVLWNSQAQGGVFGQRVEAPRTGDVNGDGVVNVSDVFYLINFLFAGGPAPVL